MTPELSSPLPEELGLNPEYLRSDAHLERKQPGVWKHVRHLVEAGALAALASTMSHVETAIAGTAEQKITPRQRIEAARLQARGEEGALAKVVREQGRLGKIGKTDIRQWMAPDSSTVVIGYDREGREIWITHEDKDASFLMLDANFDGGVDRVVMNQEPAPLGRDEKSAFNTSRAFTSLESLARGASVTARVKPEHVSVYAVEDGADGPEMKSVDYQTGEAAALGGPNAEKLVESLQGQFRSSLEVKPPVKR